MCDVWIGATEAARKFGYTRHHLYKRAREGRLRTRAAATVRKYGEREFEMNALQAYATRAEWRIGSSKGKKLAAWLQANKALWPLPRVELWRRAQAALGFTVAKSVFIEALGVAGVGRRYYKTSAAQAWIRSHPDAVYAGVMAGWRKYCREVEPVSSSVYQEAMARVRKELEAEE